MRKIHILLILLLLPLVVAATGNDRTDTVGFVHMPLYIVDGNIKGEYISPKDLEIKEKDRERLLNNWLLELGW